MVFDRQSGAAKSSAKETALPLVSRQALGARCSDARILILTRMSVLRQDGRPDPFACA